MIYDNWHVEKTSEILKFLNTTIKGLSKKEAQKRLKKNGKNILPKAKKDTIFKVLLRQLNSPINYILGVAIILSFVIGNIIDATFVIVVIVMDIALGTFQEWKAEKNAEVLQKLIKVRVNVIRNNKETIIDAENLVVGDIVKLDSGDKVPADLRLLEVHNLAVLESILTGESVSSIKINKIIEKDTDIIDRKNMVYAGTSVTRGRGIGVVVETGIDTEIGKIANRVLLIKDTKTPLVHRMEKFTKHLSIFALFIGILITIILFVREFSVEEIFFSVVALSISAIPEGLPVALTLALSIASSRMAKKNVLVKKLNSVESLGSCTIIASDKTGTLTVNEQTAKIIVLPNGKTFDIKPGVIFKNEKTDINELDHLVKLGVLNNEAGLEFKDNEWVYFGDSIDVAFLILGNKFNITKSMIVEQIVGMIPYESNQQYSAVFYKDEKDNYCTVKGSLEKIIGFCNNMEINGNKKPIDKDLLLEQNNKLAKNGYRVIALAKGKNNNFKEKDIYNDSDIPKLTLVGLIGFIDPIRVEMINSIKKCQKAGIKTVMITGDHPLTAFHIAKELGMVKSYKQVVTGDDINKYLEKGYKEFDKFIKNKLIFTRVTPIQKLEIIESYKRQGEFIAVTGDGVNDAPAMKSANIGIAMGSGTDVAKETGSMIITDDNFLSIVSGIEEGRNAYNNVRKVIYMLLSSSIAEVSFFILSILLGYQMPLIAVQLLWLNLVTDGIQDAALAFEKGEKKVMKRNPRPPKEKIFNKFMLQEMLLSGIVTGLIVFGLWIYLIDVKNFDVIVARSYVILLMVFMQNIHVLNCRSETTSIFKMPFKNNYFVILSIIGVLILQFIVVENSFLSHVLQTKTIPVLNVLIIFLLSLPILFTMEIFKYIKRKNGEI